MDSLARKLEQAFSALTRWQNALSDHWRRHTNRRTMIAILLSAALFLYLWLGILRPPERFPINELVSVPQGESLQEIADTLHESGVIRSPLAFRALMTVLGRARTAQAGDYLFKEPRDLFSVVRAMSIGAFGLEPLRIRVPEGASVAEMARIFSTQLERFDARNFIAQAEPQEGYLFPDTYYFLPNANESIVLQTLRQNFDAQIAAIQPDIDASGHPLSDIVIMASILEREAYNTKDRKLISGVLWNRIERDMPLQVDAVFAYTLGKGTFDLTMADLTSDSPYNTYKFKGLPPTPIGAPSLDSLEAAVNPTPNDYLYFLADKRGVTHYCKTYACQLANKARYF
jgi:UPF0755 protein